MVKTHEWSPTSRGKALGLRTLGRVPLREITNITTISKSTVHDINTRGTGINKARSGRPRKLSSGDICQIIRHIRLNKTTRRLSLSALKRDLLLDVHEHTIRRALQQVGYYHRVAQRRPYLNKPDRSQRLKFAKQHRDWTKEQWATVLFSDEMAVKLFMERRSKDYVWRTTEEEYHPDCINYGRRPTGVGLMFWGVFRKGKMGLGLFFDLDKGETVNSTVYRDQILLGPL